MGYAFAAVKVDAPCLLVWHMHFLIIAQDNFTTIPSRCWILSLALSVAMRDSSKKHSKADLRCRFRHCHRLVDRSITLEDSSPTSPRGHQLPVLLRFHAMLPSNLCA